MSESAPSPATEALAWTRLVRALCPACGEGILDRRFTSVCGVCDFRASADVERRYHEHARNRLPEAAYAALHVELVREAVAHAQARARPERASEKPLTEAEALAEARAVESATCHDHHDGWTCTRPRGHTGEHIACNHLLGVRDRWPQMLAEPSRPAPDRYVTEAEVRHIVAEMFAAARGGSLV